MALDANIISRSNLSGLIPEPVTREIIQGVTEGSAVLAMGRRLPNMTSKTQTLNVLDSLPIAYFVDGDTGAKKTTNMAWDKKKIYAEEVAVIVPIPEAALDDADYDIWGEVKPRLTEAFGKVIDAAILFGTNKPTNWRSRSFRNHQGRLCRAGVDPDPLSRHNGHQRSYREGRTERLYADRRYVCRHDARPASRASRQVRSSAFQG